MPHLLGAGHNSIFNMIKALWATQTLRAGCSKADPQTNRVNYNTLSAQCNHRLPSRYTALCAISDNHDQPRRQAKRLCKQSVFNQNSNNKHYTHMHIRAAQLQRSSVLTMTPQFSGNGRNLTPYRIESIEAITKIFDTVDSVRTQPCTRQIWWQSIHSTLLGK